MSTQNQCKQCGMDKLRLVNGLCAICATELKGYNDSQCATGIEAEVCRDIAERQRIGKIKYGHELADNDAPLSERLQHAYEEALDKVVYLKWAIKQAHELETELSNACSWIEENRTR